MFFRVLHCNTKKNRIRNFVIQKCITISVRTSELCSLSPVFIGGFSCNTLYYNVVHPRFFVLHCITFCITLYYNVLHCITPIFSPCITLYYIVLLCITSCITLYDNVLHCITVRITMYYTKPFCITMYYNVLRCITPCITL